MTGIEEIKMARYIPRYYLGTGLEINSLTKISPTFSLVEIRRFMHSVISLYHSDSSTGSSLKWGCCDARENKFCTKYVLLFNMFMSENSTHENISIWSTICEQQLFGVKNNHTTVVVTMLLVQKCLYCKYDMKYTL